MVDVIEKTPMEESEQEANLAIAQQQDTDDEYGHHALH